MRNDYRISHTIIEVNRGTCKLDENGGGPDWIAGIMDVRREGLDTSQVPSSERNHCCLFYFSFPCCDTLAELFWDQMNDIRRVEDLIACYENKNEKVKTQQTCAQFGNRDKRFIHRIEEQHTEYRQVGEDKIKNFI